MRLSRIRVRALSILAAAACAPLALVFSGCDMTTTSVISIPDTEPRLVVNSLFETGAPLDVRVERSYTEGGGPYNVGGAATQFPAATVDLYDGTRRVETLRRVRNYRLANRGPGRPPDTVYTDVRYVSTTAAVPSAAYTLRVAAPGLPPAEATAAAPPPPSVRIGTPRRTAIGTTRGIAVALTLDDAPGDDRYAIWAVDPTRSSGNSGQRILILSPDPVLRTGIADLVGVESPELLAAGFGGSAFFITDEEIAGRSHTFDLRLFSANDGPLTRVTLVVSRISDAYYRYERARTAQAFTEDNPLAEPVTIPSNVRGGLGIVAGRSSVRTDLSVPR